MPHAQDTHGQRRRAIRFIVLLGIVSLFADATYESARSVLGPFLAALGSTGAGVGFVSGTGELLNNSLRIGSGYFADRSGRYWLVTIAGFTLNMAAVPLLAFAGSSGTAATLSFLERIGKAIRNPPRDAMLATAARQVGHGWCFGLQEALGQIGAVTGPLLIALVLSYGYSYRFCFAMLTIPAMLTLFVLVLCYRQYSDPHTFDIETPTRDHSPLPRAYWLFLASASLVAAGYLDYPLVSYHLVERKIFAADRIPVLYAIAMGAHAIAAIGFGKLFDREFRIAIVTGCLVACPIAPLVFLGGVWPAIGGIILWGIGMGAQKAVFKATISRMIPHGQRGMAYGVFYAAYGVTWFLGSAGEGILYDWSPRSLVAASVLTQLLAVFMFLMLLKKHAVFAAGHSI